MDIGNLIVTGKKSVTSTGETCEYQSTLCLHGPSSTVQAHTDTHRTVTSTHTHLSNSLLFPTYPALISLTFSHPSYLSCHFSSFVLLPLSHSLALLHPISFLPLFSSLVAFPFPFPFSFLVDHSFPSATTQWNRPLTAVDTA